MNFGMTLNKASVLRALRFLRICDAQNNLSLTNLALFAAIFNLAFMQDVSIEAIGAFIATIVGYQVKRFAKTPVADEDLANLQAALGKLESRVTAIQLGTQRKR